MNPRIPTILATLAVATTPGLAEAKPRLQVDDLVKHAKGDPWRCDIDRDGRYGPKQNQCIVRVVFRREPRVAREAAQIISCESRWDEFAKNRSSTASGLAQFLRSTWARTPHGHKSVFQPVYNIKAMRWLYQASGHTWQQWSCRPW